MIDIIFEEPIAGLPVKHGADLKCIISEAHPGVHIGELLDIVQPALPTPFFKSGMVEGQLKGALYGHVRLDAGGQQVRKMFGLRRDHFRSEDSSRRRFNIES